MIILFCDFGTMPGEGFTVTDILEASPPWFFMTAVTVNVPPAFTDLSASSAMDSDGAASAFMFMPLVISAGCAAACRPRFYISAKP